MTTITPTPPATLIARLGKKYVASWDSPIVSEHLRKVYILAKADDPRWVDFLKLWRDEAPEELHPAVDFLLEYATEQAQPKPETQAVKNFREYQATKPKLTKPETDGMYRNPETGEIFKVQFNKAEGDGRRVYAKQLVGWAHTDLDTAEAEKVTQFQLVGKQSPMEFEFVYRAGLILQIDASWRMTMEEAKAFGALYGTCCRCGKTLTLERSIERGMGRKCASYFD